VGQDPSRAESWFELARLLADRQQRKLAIEAYRRVLALVPNNAAAWLNLGRVLSEFGRYEAAEQALARAGALDPTPPELWYNKAVLAERLGRFEAARRHYAAAIDRAPDYALAIAALIDVTRGALPDWLGQRARAVLDVRASDAESRTLVNSALARFHDRAGAHERAFAHARAANESRVARHGRFDAAGHDALIARVKAVFDADFFAARSGFGRPETSPVFIVGMPRSGTTLAEQILSAHPRVAAAGELDHFSLSVRDLPGLLDKSDPYPDCVTGLSAAEIDLLARAYLKGLAETADGAERVTNKLPFNFLRLGLIALMFPRARIIHCTRDPLDTCLSIYLHNFAAHQRWAADLEDLAAYYRAYREIMHHWRTHLPLEIFQLSHETLVDAPEETIAALLAFLGLEPDARCLRFHENPRPVMTPSLWQVRQPLSRASIGRWRNYASYLEALRRVLASGGYVAGP